MFFIISFFHSLSPRKCRDQLFLSKFSLLPYYPLSLKIINLPFFPSFSIFPFSTTPSCTPIISICIHVPYVSLDTFIAPPFLPIYIYLSSYSRFIKLFSPEKFFLQFFSQSIRVYELLVRREMSNTSKKRERIINSRRGVKKEGRRGTRTIFRTRSYVSFSSLI